MQASLQTVRAELERLSRQRQLLRENQHAGQLYDADIKKLDASVKRNTSLIKKLRNITEDNAASLLEEIARTMQSKVPLTCCESVGPSFWRGALLSVCGAKE